MKNNIQCPACGGDGKETCSNPDHGFLSGVMSLMGANESACPCCGHDPNYKIYTYKDGKKIQPNCDCCNGTGEINEAAFYEYCESTGYDNEPDYITPQSVGR